MKTRILLIVTVAAIVLIGGLFIMNAQTTPNKVAKANVLALMKRQNGSYVPLTTEYVQSLGIDVK